MKNRVLKSVVLVALAVLALGAGIASADVTVTVDPGTLTNGYMNVFDLGNNYQWGSGWGTADLTAVWSGSDVTLGPNHIVDLPDAGDYWYIGGGAPGHPGNKIMEANLYAEPVGSLPGQNVTFVGYVLSNTLTSAHVATAFIRDFAPDFSSFNTTIIPLPTSGHFTLSLATVNDPARHVQYGFQVKGPCVWATDLGPFGTATVGPASVVPASQTTWGRMKSLYR
jgi:hypothetical protein